MALIRFYPPVSDGAFLDLVDDLGRAGVSCMLERSSFIRCTWHGARFVIVHDVEGGIRAQLLDDAGLGAHAWDVIDPILLRWTAGSTRTGFYYYGLW